MQNLIHRATNQDYKAKDEGHIEGVVIKFDSPTEIRTRTGSFIEKIDRNAINEKLLKDVVLFVEHDNKRIPLARSRTKNLKFEIRDDGLYMDATLNLERTDCKDIYLAVQDEVIQGASFACRVAKDDWNLETNPPQRTIQEIGYLQEISLTANPAYRDTLVYARNSNTLDSDTEALDNARANVLDNTLELEKMKALWRFKNNV